jgi:hypothetical protein
LGNRLRLRRGDGSEVSSVASTSPAPAASVTGQLDALAAIRAALVRGDAPLAVVLVEAFEAQNPSSLVAEEAMVLHIDALTLAGRRDEAASLAATFFKTYAMSAYREHVRMKINSP